MPYADKKKQSEYQMERRRKRRDAWFKENGPCVDCGSWENLEVDHVDRSTKVDHKIWSWGESKRDVELQKCVPRCHSCHKEKTRIENSRPVEHGTHNGYAGRHKCRCQPCVQAQMKYIYDWRTKHGARGKSSKTNPILKISACSFRQSDL